MFVPGRAPPIGNPDSTCFATRPISRHRSPPSRPDFRDRGNPLEADRIAGVRRILVVGDSFTWGAGVLAQDAYPDRMQVVLDRHGATLMAAEVAVLAVATVAAIWTDPFWTRRARRGRPPACQESEQSQQGPAPRQDQP